MINQSYLQYIPKEDEEKLHYNLMVDVYYFYYGNKPTDNQKNICSKRNGLFHQTSYQIEICGVIDFHEGKISNT